MLNIRVVATLATGLVLATVPLTTLGAQQSAAPRPVEARVRDRYLREGRAGRVAPGLAARVFHSMIFGALLSRHIVVDARMKRSSADGLARGLVRVFLHGLEPLTGDK